MVATTLCNASVAPTPDAFMIYYCNSPLSLSVAQHRAGRKSAVVAASLGTGRAERTITPPSKLGGVRKYLGEACCRATSSSLLGIGTLPVARNSSRGSACIAGALRSWCHCRTANEATYCRGLTEVFASLTLFVYWLTLLSPFPEQQRREHSLRLVYGGGGVRVCLPSARRCQGLCSLGVAS